MKSTYNKNIKFIIANFAILILSIFILAEEKGPSAGKQDSPAKSGWLDSVRDFFLPHPEKREIIFSKESAYFNISVEDSSTGQRHLVFLPRKGSQSIIDISNSKIICSGFVKTGMLVFPILGKTPEKILFIGLGGGIMPMLARKLYPSAEIDIVEIDPAVADVAMKYFNFKTDNLMHVTTEDGRYFMNKNKKIYDIIVVDAYNADAIPFQLTTEEFFKLSRESLSEKGMLVANLANLGKPAFISSEIKTIAAVFSSVSVWTSPGKGNFVPIASKYEFDNELRKRIESFSKVLDAGYDIMEIYDSGMSKDDVKEMITSPEAKLLTDDYAPVEVL